MKDTSNRNRERKPPTHPRDAVIAAARRETRARRRRIRRERLLAGTQWTSRHGLARRLRFYERRRAAHG